MPDMFDTRNSITPGASAVRHIPNRGTNWYCNSCQAFIRPIFIRRGEFIYPCCRECFYDDLPIAKTDIAIALEEDHVEPATMVLEAKAPASPLHD
jgi:hypothetical protein